MIFTVILTYVFQYAVEYNETLHYIMKPFIYIICIYIAAECTSINNTSFFMATGLNISHLGKQIFFPQSIYC